MTPVPKTKVIRRPRSAPRKLVRWDNEVDMLCFLAIPRVMARRGIKFPWGEVAAYVGPHVTGNALLQHMAKETKKRAIEGRPIPEAREPVGHMSKFEFMPSAGFGDRRSTNLDLIKTEMDEEDTYEANDSGVGASSSPIKSKQSRSNRPGSSAKGAIYIKDEPTSDGDFKLPRVNKRSRGSYDIARATTSRKRVKPTKYVESTESESAIEVDMRSGANDDSSSVDGAAYRSRARKTSKTKCGANQVIVFRFTDRAQEFANMVAKNEGSDVGTDDLFAESHAGSITDNAIPASVLDPRMLYPQNIPTMEYESGYNEMYDRDREALMSVLNYNNSTVHDHNSLMANSDSFGSTYIGASQASAIDNDPFIFGQPNNYFGNLTHGTVNHVNFDDLGSGLEAYQSLEVDHHANHSDLGGGFEAFKSLEEDHTAVKNELVDN